MERELYTCDNIKRSSGDSREALTFPPHPKTIVSQGQLIASSAMRIAMSCLPISYGHPEWVGCWAEI